MFKKTFNTTSDLTVIYLAQFDEKKHSQQSDLTFYFIFYFRMCRTYATLGSLS